MEMAENVGEKRSSFMKPESFDKKFGDSSYLMTNAGKSRLRGYLTSFGYMMLCGLFLLIGGGTFFIYESVVMKQSPLPLEEDPTKPTGRQAVMNDVPPDQAKLHFSKEFQIVGFVFIAVGLVLFVIGAPLTGQFYSKYKQAKDSERSPILEGKGAKSKIYNPKETESTFESMAKTNSKKKKAAKYKRKSAPNWMYKTQRSVSKEGFRFAAHRHPSMNQISIDGSGLFDRRFSENSSGESSDDLPTIAASPQHQKSGRIGGFFTRMFSRTKEEKLPIIDNEEKLDEISDDDFAKSYEEIGPFRSTERSEDVPDTSRTGRENLTFDDDQGGLYNLGK